MKPMHRRLAIAAFATAGLFAGMSASSQDSDAIERGRAKFEYMCAPCHGEGIGDDGRAMLPGTDALRIKYRGALPALLTERSDLTYESIRVFLRQGVFSMPPFRPTEITDDEIRDIAAFIRDASQ
jgi:mono/diheme cytochrome c family protein